MPSLNGSSSSTVRCINLSNYMALTTLRIGNEEKRCREINSPSHLAGSGPTLIAEPTESTESTTISEPTIPNKPTPDPMPTVSPTPVPTSELPSLRQTPATTTPITEATPSQERAPPLITRSPSPSTQPLTTPSLVAPTLPLVAPRMTTPTPPPITPRTIPPITPPVPAPGQTGMFEHDSSYPSFIPAAVIEHLNSVDGGLCWVEMVRSYLKLESKYPLRVSHIPPHHLLPITKQLSSA